MKYDNEIFKYYDNHFPTNELFRRIEEFRANFPSIKAMELLNTNHSALTPVFSNFHVLQRLISNHNTEISSVKSLLNTLESQQLAVMQALEISSSALRQKIANDLVYETLPNSRLLDSCIVVNKSFSKVAEEFEDAENESEKKLETAIILFDQYRAVVHSITAYNDLEKEGLLDPTNLIFQNETFENFNSKLFSTLSKVGSRFAKIWEGANLSLNSDNPEKIRHTSISIRELLNQFLLLLAPDNVVKSKFSNVSDEKLFNEKGRPTRRGRLAYILFPIDNPNFYKADFFLKVTKNLNVLFDILNCGTHSFDPKQEELKLKLVMYRIGSFIQSICDLKGI
ncbi:hypothetical protein [Leptospira noguchii]|uniref:pPIWI-associating nuclease domain-containing protein n=1 Tax=Leptospira noguchii TaxID=28182 RepID=UPI001FB7762F|nr:hypothetical protein [Leptospira noguchii]UOG51019.1 hypothetical protein MAL00_20270 [Leptospira noguchii]